MQSIRGKEQYRVSRAGAKCLQYEQVEAVNMNVNMTNEIVLSSVNVSQQSLKKYSLNET